MIGTTLSVIMFIIGTINIIIHIRNYNEYKKLKSENNELRQDNADDSNTICELEEEIDRYTKILDKLKISNSYPIDPIVNGDDFLRWSEEVYDSDNFIYALTATRDMIFMDATMDKLNGNQMKQQLIGIDKYRDFMMKHRNKQITTLPVE